MVVGITPSSIPDELPWLKPTSNGPFYPPLSLLLLGPVKSPTHPTLYDYSPYSYLWMSLWQSLNTHFLFFPHFEKKLFFPSGCAMLVSVLRQKFFSLWTLLFFCFVPTPLATGYFLFIPARKWTFKGSSFVNSCFCFRSSPFLGNERLLARSTILYFSAAVDLYPGPNTEMGSFREFSAGSR